MGLFSKDIKSLEDLFKHALQDLYYAENQIVRALPDMIEKATDEQLRASFEQHREETEGQINRLQQVFEMLGEKPSGTKCPAIDGILKEGKELMGEIGDEDTMNAGLSFAAQAVEHYEITRYGALIAYASELGHNDCVPLLKSNLAEEKASDKKLSLLSEKRFNPQADKKSTKKPASATRRAKPKTTARRPAKHASKKRKRA